MKPLTLYIDQSENSKQVQKEFDEKEIPYKIVYSSFSKSDTPAVSGLFGSLYGYTNIRRYMLGPES